MRAELKRLQETLRLTTIFVTHDQHEALALSDRIAVMREGRIEQVGTPVEIYEQPASTFVAGFVGGTNLLTSDDGATLAVKPERVRLSADPAQGRRGTITGVAYQGSAHSYLIAIGTESIE